jgi:chromosome partitioning protein
VTDADDAAARSRAIFERLRADQPGEGPDQMAPLVSSSGDGTAADDQPVADPGHEPIEAGAHAARSGLPGAEDLQDLTALLGTTAPSEDARRVGEPGQPGPTGPLTSGPPVEADAPAETVAPSPDDDVADDRPTADLAAAVEAAPPAVTDGHDHAEEAAAAIAQTPEGDADPTSTSTAGDAPSADPPGNGFARPLPRVMAVANQKGGVGKTTTAVNLGACLADIGYRVLVVDLDPQGNASTGLGINIRDLQGSMYDVILHDLPIEDCVEATSVRNLFCAPSSLDLAGAEIELVPAFSRELRLKRALEEVHDDYDFVLIDCPPSLGLLTVNGLAAATEVVVPIQCEYYALEGLGQLLRNVNLVQRNLNPRLELSAIILVMYDARTKLADQVVTEVRAHFGAKVCRNVVPRTVRLSEAPSFGQPIIAFDSSSRGAIAYRELAKEVSGGTPQRAG